MKTVKALTLIEVMVAVTIFALLSVSLFSFMSAAFKIKKNVYTKQRYDFKAKIALDQLSRELESSVNFYGDMRDFNSTSQELSFYTVHSDKDEEAILKLNYFTEDNSLMRQTQSIYQDKSEAKPKKIFDFDDLAFAYWDQGNSTWQDSWQEKDNIPHAVRVQKTSGEDVLERYIVLYQANQTKEEVDELEE